MNEYKICIKCGSINDTPNKKKCSRCREINRMGNLKKWKKEQPPRYRQKRQLIMFDDIVGKCLICGNNILKSELGRNSGITLCKKCCKKKYEKTKLRREQIRQNGKCIHHPNEPIVEGKKFCAKCLWYAILYNHPSITDEEVTKVLEQQNYICPISGRILIKGINTSIEHIISVGKERYNENNELNKINNIMLVDEQFNRWKECMTIEEFTNACREVVIHQDKLKKEKEETLQKSL